MVELTAEDMARYADECCKKAAELFDEGKIKREAVSEAAASMGRINGELLGRTMAAIQAGYAAGYTRYMEENRLDEDGFPTKAGGKTIDDCRKCKCNYCANLEQCKRRQKGKEHLPEDGKPAPCVGCGGGEIFAKKELPCMGFAQADTPNYTNE